MYADDSSAPARVSVYPFAPRAELIEPLISAIGSVRPLEPELVFGRARFPFVDAEPNVEQERIDLLLGDKPTTRIPSAASST